MQQACRSSSRSLGRLQQVGRNERNERAGMEIRWVCAQVFEAVSRKVQDWGFEGSVERGVQQSENYIDLILVEKEDRYRGF